MDKIIEEPNISQLMKSGSSKMDPHEREILGQNKELIAKEVVASEKTSDVIYELQQSGVITEATAKFLLTQETTKTTRVRLLVDELMTCGPGSFTRFLEILMQFNLESLVQKLSPDIYNEALSRLSVVSEDLELQQTPYHPGVTLSSLAQPLPSLPRPPLVSPAAPPSPRDDAENNNPAKPLKIKVVPYAEIGGAKLHQNEVYRNRTMPRGYVFLANYHSFHENQHPPRDGSELDVKHLMLLFSQMGYKITEPHLNMTKYDTILALRDFCRMDELDTVDSVVVVIMSHGRDHGSFYTSDNNYLSVNDVVERFSNRECPALKGKPKIFIFQYCRGSGPDIGVAPRPQPVSNRPQGVAIQTDAANYGEAIVHRDPTFTDMYIVYSTVEGFVSFRHPERGSWLMEAICCVFMDHACTHDLDSLMKMVSRRMRENCTDDGNKQVCEFVQRAFDRHFFFNPEPLAEMGLLNLSSLSRALAEDASPQERLSPRVRPRHKVRARSSSREARRRNLSGASGGSREGSMEDLLCQSPRSETSPRHPRVRDLVQVSQRRYSQPCYPNPATHDLTEWNRSFSESEENIAQQAALHQQQLQQQLIPQRSAATPEDECRDMVDHRMKDADVNMISPRDVNANRTPLDLNIPPNSRKSLNIGGLSPMSPTNESVFSSGDSRSPMSTEEGAGAIRDLMSRSILSAPSLGSFAGPENGGADESVRYSFKRQLSVPSSNETLEKLNDVKRYLQVHESDPKLLKPLQRIESFVNKKKNEGKRRKVDEDDDEEQPKSASLEY